MASFDRPQPARDSQVAQEVRYRVTDLARPLEEGEEGGPLFHALGGGDWYTATGISRSEVTDEIMVWGAALRAAGEGEEVARLASIVYHSDVLDEDGRPTVPSCLPERCGVISTFASDVILDLGFDGEPRTVDAAETLDAVRDYSFILSGAVELQDPTARWVEDPEEVRQIIARLDHEGGHLPGSFSHPGYGPFAVRGDVPSIGLEEY